MRYMMFIQHNEHAPNVTPPQALYDAMGEFVGAEMKSGRIIDTAGLKPTKDGTRIRSNAGKLTSVDGPFAESKEIIGGYALVEAASRAEAMELATRFMELHRVHWPEFDCTCEVRPVEDPEAPPSVG
jgi:hypothetical protein